MPYEAPSPEYHDRVTGRSHISALVRDIVPLVPKESLPMTLPILVTISRSANAHRSMSKQSSGEKSMNVRHKAFRSAQGILTRVSLFSLMLLLFSQLIFGQGITTGSISGTVQDPQQQVISGASVTAVQNGTNTPFTARTNSVGAFELRGLQVGTYTVTIEASGFGKTQVNNVATNAGRATSFGLQTLAVASQ